MNFQANGLVLLRVSVFGVHFIPSSVEKTVTLVGELSDYLTVDTELQHADFSKPTNLSLSGIGLQNGTR